MAAGSAELDDYGKYGTLFMGVDIPGLRTSFFQTEVPLPLRPTFQDIIDSILAEPKCTTLAMCINRGYCEGLLLGMSRCVIKVEGDSDYWRSEFGYGGVDCLSSSDTQPFTHATLQAFPGPHLDALLDRYGAPRTCRVYTVYISVPNTSNGPAPQCTPTAISTPSTNSTNLEGGLSDAQRIFLSDHFPDDQKLLDDLALHRLQDTSAHACLSYS
ncbi:hypothetical protein BOTBODRAFT_177339 [Botryobasidium botryosum FD-172 SS1]|uniref:Uncharacterized protein n=1 Tax=Botryobasidium botryosum (strain FD-172 SS1) TaxID=930990 RepID=A0A067M6W9_BOTB1|nr:hypothetical protein BOTBODRAFT_177339 [Botryobasidium botryosum FD-172 SS1]